MTGHAENESQADLLKATGPTSIVLAAIRRHHERPDGCGICAHDDIAGLLNIIKRAHDGLVSLYDERDAATARAEQAEAEIERLREENDLLRVDVANATPDHDALAEDAIQAHEEAERLRAELAELRRRLGEDENGRDLSGWSAEENAEFEKLYGVEAAMRLKAANDRAWAVVQELRNEAVEAGRDPYQDPMAQRLATALVGSGGEPNNKPAVTERPVNPVGLIDTLKRVSGLTDGELGKLIGVSGNAVCLWSMGGRINQAHYDRVMDLNSRMQKLPSKTFYGRREALFDASGGRSMYDQMLAELSTPALEPEGPPAYFNVQDG